MLWMIAMLLTLLWLLGLMISYTMGGYIHLLLAAALVMAIVHIIQGRRTA
jgi:hypothetical protein